MNPFDRPENEHYRQDVGNPPKNGTSGQVKTALNPCQLNELTEPSGVDLKARPTGRSSVAAKPMPNVSV